MTPLVFKFDRRSTWWQSIEHVLTIAAILVGFTSLYVFSVGIPFYSSDGQVMYDTAWSIGVEGRLDVNPAPLPQLITNDDGQTYSKYDPGLPLLASHIVYYADGVAAKDGADRYAVGAIFVMIIPALCMALANVGVYLLAYSFSQQQHMGIFAAVVSGVGTTIWPYSRLFFAEAITTATITLAAAWLFVPTQLKSRHVFAAAMLMALALMTRIHTVIFAIAIIYPIWQRATNNQQQQRFVAIYMSVFVIGGSMWLLHNWVRFESFWRTGYEGEAFSLNPLLGVVGLLVSPGKGVFWHAPPLIISALLFPRLRRQQRVYATSLLLLTTLGLVFYGAWWAWHGGWVWGPRFLVPLMPLWCVAWVALPQRSTWIAVASITLTIGIVVQLIGTFSNVNPAYTTAFANAPSPDDKSRYAMIHYDLDYTPIVAGWQQIAAGDIEPQAIYQLQETELSQDWVYGVPQAIERWLLISVIILGWQVWRGLKRELKDTT